MFFAAARGRASAQSNCIQGIHWRSPSRWRLSGQVTGSLQHFDVLGVPVSVTDLDRVEALIHSWMRDGQGRMITAPDVSNIVRSQDDQRLMQVHWEAAVVCPDGMPLVWLGRRMGLPVKRTCGPDLLAQMLASRPGQVRHYLFGGRAGVAAMLALRAQQQVPGVDIVAAHSPPYSDLDDVAVSELAEDIRRTKADIVWLGISSPRQEILMRRLVRQVPATLIAVGAAFDFYSGTVPRAPIWMQRSGLEWLHRLAQEPARLWRRYLIMAPRFVLLVAMKRLLR